MRVQFGTFVLDPETRELLRGDAHVPLSPKAFDLLSILVSHRPRAMAKSDLPTLRMLQTPGSTETEPDGRFPR
jgi:DNA-binding winged helix-turn-helix (wHTH) protein